MQIKLSKLLHLLVLSAVSASIEAAKFLAEKPAFLRPCQLEDAQFRKCLAANLQPLFHEWKDGLPGTTVVGSLDPLYVKRVKISQDANSAIAINADMQNVYIKGASKAVVKDASYDPSHYTAKVFVHLPKLRFEFDYKVKGHVSALNLNSQGKGNFEAENALLSLELKVKPRNTPEATFADLERTKAEIIEIGGFHIQLENLFGGNKELEQTAHSLFNENWRIFYDILRPALEQAVESILQDRFKKTLNYVPANYFIHNFH